MIYGNLCYTFIYNSKDRIGKKTVLFVHEKNYENIYINRLSLHGKIVLLRQHISKKCILTYSIKILNDLLLISVHLCFPLVPRLLTSLAYSSSKLFERS